MVQDSACRPLRLVLVAMMPPVAGALTDERSAS
jgi:hypothetical protein